MLRSDHAGPASASSRGVSFFLYVEGPRDRDILQTWAHRVSPPLARRLADGVMILGGRQPARAVEHFQSLGADNGRRALCVLDRDDGVHGSMESDPRAAGLEFYTWRRRHIESYLLVPDAIRRALRVDPHDARVDRLFRQHLPAPDDEDGMADIDAKRLLNGRGPLSRGLGRELAPSRIARAMRAHELHPDVLDCLDRVRQGLGLPRSQPRVVARPR